MFASVKCPIYRFNNLDLHEVRPHPGQMLTAARLWQLLHATDNGVSEDCASSIISKIV